MSTVNGYITRKTMLYETGVEYGDYTMNHVQGCNHGCKFPCYAFMMKKRFGVVSDYEEWIKPKLVSNTLELLDSEIPRLKNKIESVQLCFSTDPFMYRYDDIANMSIAAIRKLNEAGIKCTVLTKGILPLALTELSDENEYGITLVSLDETYRRKMEPNAAPYQERLAALRELHNAGCKTWVSIEPYPTPNIISQDLGNLLDVLSFTDRIIFGRTNYSKEVSAYKDHKKFYNACANQVISFCKEQNITYHIKNKTIFQPVRKKSSAQYAESLYVRKIRDLEDREREIERTKNELEEKAKELDKLLEKINEFETEEARDRFRLACAYENRCNSKKITGWNGYTATAFVKEYGKILSGGVKE